jgi:hypothetical protein
VRATLLTLELWLRLVRSLESRTTTKEKETAPLMGSMVSIYIFGQDNTPISELAQRHVRLADDGRMRLAA